MSVPPESKRRNRPGAQLRVPAVGDAAHERSSHWQRGARLRFRVPLALTALVAWRGPLREEPVLTSAGLAVKCERPG
jgi:hypothetical protein